MNKPHLSITQLNMIQRCGLQYQYRYCEGIKSPPGVSLIIGRGTHEPIEKDLQNKIEWGELLPDEAVKDHAAESTARAWDEQPVQRADGDPDRGGAIDTAVTLATLHHRQIAPHLDPIAVERGFILELPGFSHDIMGYVDVEEEHTIRDTKTSAKSPPPNVADVSDQLTLYHLDATVRGQPGKDVALDYLIKTATPKALTLKSTRGPWDHARLLRRIEAAAAVIKSGAFQPVAPDAWCCSEKWCGYWDLCDFGSKKKISVGLIDPTKLVSRLAERKT